MPCTRISCSVSAAAVRLACHDSASWRPVTAPKSRHTTIAPSRSRLRVVGTCAAWRRATSSSREVPSDSYAVARPVPGAAGVGAGVPTTAAVGGAAG